MGLLETIDFHVHTTLSDGELDMEETAWRYAERGFTHVAFTDHVGRSPERITAFEKARRLVDRLNAAENGLPRLYLSAEIVVEDEDGRLVCPDFERMKGILDYVSIAAHCWAIYQKNPEKVDLEFCHRMQMVTAEHPEGKVILHPWDVPAEVVPDFTIVPRNWFREFAEACARNGKVVELSNCISHYWTWRGRKQAPTYGLLVRELLDAGVKFVIGSDGHTFTNRTMLPDFPVIPPTAADTAWAVMVFRECGGADEDIWLPPERRG